MGIIKCANCNKEIDIGFKYCPFCGIKYDISVISNQSKSLDNKNNSNTNGLISGYGCIGWLFIVLSVISIFIVSYAIIENYENIFPKKETRINKPKPKESQIDYLIEPKPSNDSDKEDETNFFHLKKICAEEVPYIRSTINNLLKDVRNLESTATSNYGSNQFTNYLTNWNKKALINYEESKLKCEDPYISATYGQILYFKWLYGKEFIDPSNYGSLDMKATRKDLFDYINELQYVLKCYDRFDKNCVVKSKSINIREGPDKDYYGVIGKLNYMDEVYVSDVDYDWCKIEKNNKIGWVLFKYLDPI